MAGLIPFNKNNPIMRTDHFNDLYNMLDDFFNDTWPSRNLLRDSFKIDIQENEKEYVIEAELPGIKKENISVDLNEGKLTIAVTHSENTEEKKQNYIHKERRYGAMSRSVYLADVKTEGIKAQFKDGILEISVPREEPKNKSTKIDIQ